MDRQIDKTIENSFLIFLCISVFKNLQFSIFTFKVTPVFNI